MAGKGRSDSASWRRRRIASILPKLDSGFPANSHTIRMQSNSHVICGYIMLTGLMDNSHDQTRRHRISYKF